MTRVLLLLCTISALGVGMTEYITDNPAARVLLLLTWSMTLGAPALRFEDPPPSPLPPA